MDPDEPFIFQVLTLLPERNPPGPRVDHVLLGNEFLSHYGFRVILDYSEIGYSPTSATIQGRIDPSVPCGVIEKD